MSVCRRGWFPCDGMVTCPVCKTPLPQWPLEIDGYYLESSYMAHLLVVSSELDFSVVFFFKEQFMISNW